MSHFTRWFLVLSLLSQVFFACGNSTDSQPNDLSFEDLTLDLSSPADAGVDVKTLPDVPVFQDLSPEIEPINLCDEELVPLALEKLEDETFDLGPYLMNVTQSSAVVMWRTLDKVDGKVVVLINGEELEVSQKWTSFVHELTITGLEPGEAYRYRAESAGLSSSEHVFRTAPLPGAPFRFVGWADNQNGPAVFAEQVSLMIDDGPDLAIAVGDLVQTGKIEALWKEQLFGPARALLHQVPLFAAIGNHEGNSHFWYDLMSYPYPSGEPEHETYYYFTWGNTFFLVFNPFQLPCAFGEVETPHSIWMKEAVQCPEAKAATWRIAYAHEPAVSESWGDGSCTYHGNGCIRNDIMPLLAENGFHAYFAGHTHAWERGNLEGMIHLIMGGGGGSTDAWCYDEPSTEVVHTAHHHIRVDVGCETLRIEGVGLDGEVFDWVEIAPTSPVTILDQGPADWLPPPDLNSDRPL
jgi:Calcineurin-like phosphoesterase/Purple acid Phosphatase, N-terminal domain